MFIIPIFCHPDKFFLTWHPATKLTAVHRYCQRTTARNFLHTTNRKHKKALRPHSKYLVVQRANKKSLRISRSVFALFLFIRYNTNAHSSLIWSDWRFSHVTISYLWTITWSIRTVWSTCRCASDYSRIFLTSCLCLASVSKLPLIVATACL